METECYVFKKSFLYANHSLAFSNYFKSATSRKFLYRWTDTIVYHCNFTRVNLIKLTEFQQTVIGAEILARCSDCHVQCSQRIMQVHQTIFPSIGSVVEQTANLNKSGEGDDESLVQEIESLCVNCGENVDGAFLVEALKRYAYAS